MGTIRSQASAMSHSQIRSSNRIIPLILAFLGLTAGAAFGQTYTLSPPPFLVAQNNSGAIINGACIWTYLAGTSTPADTYQTSSGTLNSNPIIADSAGRFTAYLQPGISYKFVYESACVPPAHGSTLRTADNVAAVPTSGLNVDVTGTAGETINAADVVYLSDGSGSLNAGQWYRADADLIYGSIGAGQIGIAPAAIASAASGSIRIQGRVTGLSSLTVGAPHYVSATVATLTATAPVNARLVGVADSATSLVVTPNPAAALDSVTPGICQGRLTLTTATPVTSADVTAATTLYFTPYKGNRCALFDGNRWREYAFTERSIAVPATTSQMYDVYLYDNAGTLTLELTAWTNDTTRATAITFQNGVYVKTGATTRLYLGSFRTTGVSGQTEDSFAKRYVWNYYNRLPRPLRRFETTATWTYTTATIRQARADTANQVDVVVGVTGEARLELTLLVVSANDNANIERRVHLGEDSTTTAMTAALSNRQTVVPANQEFTHHMVLRHYPAVGRHFYAWLEWGSATGTTTWSGVPIGAANSQSGLTGSIEG